MLRQRQNIVFNLSCPLRSFTGRKLELEFLKKTITTDLAKFTKIVGMGGIGKSELVRAYCHQNLNAFKNIVIFNIFSAREAENCIYQLAGHLQIPMFNFINLNRKTKSPVEILREIYKLLDGRGRTLVVLDNVENFEHIRDFIFTDIMQSMQFLITTRNQYWGLEGEALFILNPYENFEAVDYIQNNLSVDCNIESVEKLAFEMDYLPLALRQAVSFINHKNNSINAEADLITINNFLELYNAGDYEIFEPFINDDNYLADRTIFTNWEYSLRMIERIKDITVSESIFSAMGYLDPVIHLANILQGNAMKNRTLETIDLLINTSLITVHSRGKLMMNKITQYVARWRAKKSGCEEQILKNLLTDLEIAPDVQHKVCVWKYACKYPSLIVHFYKKSYVIDDSIKPLHFMAVCCSELATMQLMVDCLFVQDRHLECNIRLQMDARNRFGETPLYLAVTKNHMPIVEFFVCIGATVNIQYGSEKRTVLHVAIYNNYETIAKYFVENCQQLIYIPDENCVPPLEMAALNGQTELIKSFTHCNQKHKFYALLCNAIMRNSFEEFQHILRNQIRRNAHTMKENFSGFTVVNCSLTTPETKYLKLMLQLGGKVDTVDLLSRTPLYHAAVNGYPNIVKMLLDNGANPNTANNKGVTPFHAVGMKNTEISMLLLNKGVNPNCLDISGNTLLHLACQLEHKITIDMLLSYGANVNIVNFKRETPLHIAAKGKTPEIVSKLLNFCAFVNVIDASGRTPLIHATVLGNLKITQILMAAGANSEIGDFKNKKAMHHAAKIGHLRIIRHLVTRGAIINARDQLGRTPLSYAQWCIGAGADRRVAPVPHGLTGARSG